MSTESFNSQSKNLNSLSSTDYVNLHIQEESRIFDSLKQASQEIAKTIDLIHRHFLANGWTYEIESISPYQGPRLFYIGAGTSGRLGILDAVECPPTFFTPAEMIQGHIAGGDTAIRQAVEGAEDDSEAAVNWVKANLKSKDILVGISASGSAPCVIGALEEAQRLGCLTVAIANNQNAQNFKKAKHSILIETGPEILSGSTRLKAGTSQKICLNILSTGLMIKLHKTYGNLMVNVKTSNIKLRKRALALVVQITKANEEEALNALESSNYRVKHAVLKILRGLNYQEAEAELIKHNGSLEGALLSI